MSMKSLYNWFTQKAERQFTLGQSLMGLDGYELSNGERMLDRAFTGAGIVAGIVAAVTGHPQDAIGYMAIGKATGLMAAAFAKVSTRGIQFEPAYAVTVNPSVHVQPYRR